MGQYRSVKQKQQSQLELEEVLALALEMAEDQAWDQAQDQAWVEVWEAWEQGVLVYPWAEDQCLQQDQDQDQCPLQDQDQTLQQGQDLAQDQNLPLDQVSNKRENGVVPAFVLQHSRLANVHQDLSVFTIRASLTCPAPASKKINL